MRNVMWALWAGFLILVGKTVDTARRCRQCRRCGEPIEGKRCESCGFDK